MYNFRTLFNRFLDSGSIFSPLGFSDFLDLPLGVLGQILSKKWNIFVKNMTNFRSLLNRSLDSGPIFNLSSFSGFPLLSRSTPRGFRTDSVKEMEYIFKRHGQFQDIVKQVFGFWPDFQSFGFFSFFLLSRSTPRGFRTDSVKKNGISF